MKIKIKKKKAEIIPLPNIATRYRETMQFLEMVEALTNDPNTSDQIRAFLVREGFWKENNSNNGNISE